jgi:hypothetical protein
VSARVVAAVSPDGRLVARKRSRDGADAARLRHEADVLRAARHPGVVELVDCESDGDDVLLATEFAGTHSLDTLPLVPVEQAAGIVAAVATTVADLHEIGIVHGRIDLSHVLVGTAGRPLLCGFAGGGRVGSAPPPGPPLAAGFADPAAPSDATLTPETDVYGLGCLLRSLVLRDHDDVEPIPERRWRFDSLKKRWSGFHARALLTLADRATDDVPSRRPPARRFAQDVLDTVPDAVLVGAPERDDRSSATERRLAPTTLTGVGVLVGLGALGLLGMRATWSTASPDLASSTTTPATAAVLDSASPLESTITATSATSTTSTTTAAKGGLDCPAGLRAPDLDGDGCGDPVHLEDERTVVVGSRRFTAGQPGDRVAVGDWDCDGLATVAVLRPSTGAVFVFETWASSGTDVVVSPVAVTPDAVDLQARQGQDGCATLVAIRRDGTTQEVA